MNTNPHHLLGAYVLGGLDAADLTLFEVHLPDCAGCRKELAVLEKVPMLLDSLPVPDALALSGVPVGSEAADAGVPVRLFDELAHRRRTLRRRWAALAGAVAAACLAVGLAVGPMLVRPPQPDAT